MSTLSPQAVQRVLRRAAELEKRPPEGQSPSTTDVSEAELTAIAAEVGIAPEAINRALAEHRAGALAVPEPPSLVDRVVGPSQLVFTRTVGGAYATVRAAVDEFLNGQLLHMKRNLGDSQIWQASTDFWSRVRRVADMQKRVWLRDCEIEVATVALGGSQVMVRFTLRLAEPRRRRAWEAFGGAAAGVAIGAAGLAAFHGLPLDALAIVGGGSVSASSLIGARRRYHRDLERAQNALERFLDSLEHERVPAVTATSGRAPRRWFDFLP